MPHGQAKEFKVFKNFAAPSGTSGESFIVSWTNGVDGDDISLFPTTGSNSNGFLKIYLGGSLIFRFEAGVSHLDAGSGATLWGSGGVHLGKSDNRFKAGWFEGHQITAESGVWSGREALGYEEIIAQSVTGANQTLTPQNQLIRLAGNGASSVDKISKPPGDFPTVLTIIFDDANVTMNDSGTGGAAETMNLVGNYTSSADGTLVLLWCNTPASGNDRWVEISRTNP